MSNLNNTPINPLNNEQTNNNKNIDFNLRDIIRENVIKNNNLIYDENIINFVHNDLETRIKTKERNTRSWELLRLNFSNLCIYGSEQNINFASLPYNEVILISGNNNVGKSSLIDIITFILYNRMARELNIGRKIASDIVNVNHKTGYGELHVKIADKIYIIRKEISRSASNKITIKPFIYEGEQVLYNSADKVAETVEDIFGTFDDFIFMNMMLQFDNVPFRSMKQPDRKELLNRLLGLDQYERIESDIKPLYKDIERQNNELKKKLDKIDPQSLNDKMAITNIKITEISTKITELQDEKTQIISEIDELNKSYNSLEKVVLLVSTKNIISKKDNLVKESTKK
jgi:DNA repair exonuclease SbcCD ATPase subunit